MARILVVDDSALVVRFVQHSLVEDGHDVRSLDSFIQLAARVRDNPPDLIILDLNIPALSGVSMGKLVRNHQSRHIPIIVYSSAPQRELEAAAKAVGAHCYVRKSDDVTALRYAVRRVLENRQAADW
jgi:DNA-binding response OmpR family regulator